VICLKSPKSGQPSFLCHGWTFVRFGVCCVQL
jgi:hypothetical protein